MLIMQRKILLTLSFVFGSLWSIKAQTDSLIVASSSSILDNKFVKSLALDTICAGDETTVFETKNFIIPAAVITYGFGLRFIPGLKTFDRNIQKEIQKGVKMDTEVENAIMFLPIVSVYALDWCGVPARHSFKDRAIVTASSFSMAYGAVLLSKFLTERARPDMSSNRSFPSGHTTAAFAGAHILMKEYKHISPWIGVSGYAVATSVGFLRLANNKHWFSDVIVGAGFGILSVELSYLLLPHLSRMIVFGNKNERKVLTLNPSFGYNWGGIGLSYQF